MIKYITLTALIFLATVGLAQRTDLLQYDLNYNGSYLSKGRLGQKLLFQHLNNKIIETDGTPQGTKEFDFISRKVKFLSISTDSLLIISSYYGTTSYATKIYLYTSAMTTPQEIHHIPHALLANQHLEQNGTNIIWQKNGIVTFFNTSTLELNIETYGELLTTSGLNTISFGDYFFIENNHTLFKIKWGTTTLEQVATFSNRITHFFDSDLDHFYFISKGFLWSSDGTTDNTFVVKDLSSETPYSGYYSHHYFLGDTMVFSVISYWDDEKIFIYSTDGTEEGTKKIKTFSIEALSQGALYYQFFKVNQKLFLAYADTLWQTDGTALGTVVFNTNPAIQSFRQFKQVNPDNILLIGRDGGTRGAAYYFDGTPNVIPLTTSNRAQNRMNYFSYFASYQDSINCFINFVDLEYGKELHHFNYNTKKVRIFDDSPGSQWSNSTVLSYQNDELIFIKKIGNKAYLISYKNFSQRPEPSPMDNSIWTELLTSSLYGGRSELLGFTADHANNSLLLINTDTYSKDSIYFVRNDVALAQNAKNLVKIAPDGHVLWTRSLPYSSINNKKAALAVDTKNNLIVGYQFYGDQAIINGVTITSDNGRFILLKYDPEGQLLWFHQSDIGKFGIIESIITDNTDQVFITGKYYGPDAYIGNNHLTAERNYTTFLLKCSQDGNILWVDQYPLSQKWPIDHGQIKITLDKSQNPVFFQRMDTDEQLSECTGIKHRFKIISVSSSSGQTTWKREFEGEDFCYPADIATSPSGNIFVVGGYNQNIYFDEFHLISDSCTQANRFLLELNTKGETVAAKKINHTGDFINQILFDNDDNYYLVGSSKLLGYYGINMPTDTSYWVSTYWDGHDQIFIKKYNPIGEVISQNFINQNTNYFTHNSAIYNFKSRIHLLDNNRISLACEPKSLLDTFSVTSFTKSSGSIFLAHLPLNDASNFAQADGEIHNQNIFISPNPAGDYLHIQSNDLDFTDVSITIFSMDGKQWQLPIESNHGFVRINTKILPKGIYAIAIQLGDTLLSQKFVKN